MSKHIKLFEAFIEKEDTFNSVDDINQLLDYTWNPNDNQIWRGDKRRNKSYIFRIDGTERSGNTNMSKIIRLLPSWRKFSNRLKSVIGTTSFKYAYEWFNTERVYSIIPLKDEIFVGVSLDINRDGAFPLMAEIMDGHNETSINKFLSDVANDNINTDIEQIIKELHIDSEDYQEMKYLFDKYVDDRKDSSWSNLEELLNKTNNTFYTIRRKLKYHKLIDYVRRNNIKSTLELFDNVLDPIKNGYRKMKYSDYVKMSGQRRETEVWFECDCIFIDKGKLDKIDE